ncbi:hypothetical protein QJS10_CPA08g00468 [Acorus calamus]|uniref:Uncharacterized protein n=1 Tax=Acorus calamus TaxID=4465 RepID=A0AAV9EDE4_ACOCL|nr:hypothetical protein QJS10_CPA08g00468 [Acorus calamus]
MDPAVSISSRTVEFGTQMMNVPSPTRRTRTRRRTFRGRRLRAEEATEALKPPESSLAAFEAEDVACMEVDPESFAREYQLEALEKAKKENTIVFLETGSGKTLIAVMLLRSYAHLIRKPSEGIAVFLAPTVHLVAQVGLQARVLETLTDLKVGKFWGEMGVDFWSGSTWNEKLREFEVFVMTPAILRTNLRHSFFKLDCIKLLIFDECHNIRGKSDYACIMREHYHPQLCSNRGNLPRILGMTASLIKRKGPSSQIAYKKHISEIESLLHSKVYTVANESILAQYVPFPTPKIKFYEHVGIPSDLHSRIADNLERVKIKHSLDLQKLGLDDLLEEGLMKRISKLCNTFLYCLTELGLWMAIKAVETLSCSENDIFFWGEAKDKIDITINGKLVKIFELIWMLIVEEPQSVMPTWLLVYRKNIDLEVKDLRCIIFVERIITAIVLRTLLSQVPKLLKWKTSYAVGNNSGMQSQSKKEQIDTVDAFREGKVNIIVATQILEEGLDVQSCNLVIRGDSTALSRVMNYLASGDIMREESLRQASLPCAPIGNRMSNEGFYRVESTGATVTLSSSVQLIYFYCSRLPSDGYFKSSPRFVIDKESSVSSLYLPKTCPIQNVFVKGNGKSLKQILCLEACKKLHEIGALTDYLLPEFGTEAEGSLLDIEVPFSNDVVGGIAAQPCHLHHGSHLMRMKDDSTNATVELPPELCVIVMSPISINTLYSFSFIPSIMHRIESILLAAGLKKQLDPYTKNVVPTLKVLEALTTKRCQEAFSLESLETLGTKHLKYKVVSDVAEALIGAYLSTAGEMAALNFLNWLGVEVDFNNKVLDDAQFLARPETYVNRLEFLGDAVLDYLITVHLYNVYPGLSPGLLTDLRSASVNNNCYAHAAAKFGLNKHILHASSEFHRQMSDYFSKFGESFAGYSYGWEAGAALPKASLFTVLADVIESLAGAILVDSGFNKDVVWKSIRPLLEPLVSPDTIKYHPVRELGDICAKNSFRKTFTMSHENGIASITAEVEAEGTIYRETKTGKNKKEAKALAADAMLKSLKAGISCL